MLAKLKNLGAGKRTYLHAGALVLLSVLVFSGKVQLDQQQWEAIVTLLLGGGLAALRSGVSAETAKTAEKLAGSAGIEVPAAAPPTTPAGEAPKE